jgi:parallel beta-helix repeat protein
LCGIAALGHVGIQVIGNTIERNNRLAFRTWEVGGIKFHFAYYSLIEGNLVRDTDGFGIWMDNTFYKCRITRNVIVNNYFAGIFPELAEGPLLIDNNVIAYTRHGDGIYSHDASGFTIAHNLIYSNANYGVWTVVATDRGGPQARVTSSHQRIYNNILFANHAGAIGLPFPFERAQDNISDANLFMGEGSMDGESTGLAPTFRYHGSHKRVPTEKIIEAFAAALSDVPPEQRPNLKLWSERPDLTLDQWRAFSGNDRNSLVTRISDDIMGLHTLEVRFNFMRTGRNASPIDELWKVRSVPVGGVEADFFGIPLPQEGALPGPFQNVVKGPNRWLVWPVDPLLKGYPLEAGEEPHVEASFNENVRVRHGCAQRRQ